MGDVETLLRRNIAEVFGQRDATPRRQAIAEIFAADCVFTAPDGAHQGRDTIDAAVAALHARLPDFVFSAGTARILDGAGLIEWTFGPSGEPDRIAGTDVVLCHDNRISHLMVFLKS
jgi:hypothetical protein